jgi:hypothetical protein
MLRPWQPADAAAGRAASAPPDVERQAPQPMDTVDGDHVLGNVAATNRYDLERQPRTYSTL